MITRTRQTRNYTVVPNRIHRELTPDTRLYHLFLLAQKPSYQPHTTRDAPKVGIGRDRLRRAARELVEKGYMTRLQTRHPDGRWGWRTVVYDTPCDLHVRDEGAGQTRDWDSVPGDSSSVSTSSELLVQLAWEADMPILDVSIHEPKYVPEKDTKRPATRPTPKERAQPTHQQPKKLSAWGLSQRFSDYAAHYRFDLTRPATGPMGRMLKVWHERDGKSYEVLYTAIDLFWGHHQGDAGEEPWRLFIRSRDTWIIQAEEWVYRQELPAKQADYRRRLNEWYDIMRAKLAEVDPTIPFRPGVAREVLIERGIDFPRWRG